MNSDLRKAAIEGTTGAFQDMEEHDLHMLVTPANDTILHIHITSPSDAPKSTDFVKEILEKCPLLLEKANLEGDTPLHAAAKYGNSDIVKVLIEEAQCQRKDLESGEGDAKLRMLRKKNNDGNTALHEAVKNRRLYVVKILTKQDPGFPYAANNYGQTPLFIAAQRGSPKMVDFILKSCESAAHEGPDGKTALHAAVMGKNQEAVKIILEYKKSLTEETDQHGWTPLHYAAYNGDDGCFSIVKLLLEYGESAAYMVDKKRKMTPLHLAAGQESYDIMEAIISRCPDCCRIVDIKGWNFLHFAITGFSFTKCWSNFLIKNTKYKDLMRDLLHRENDRGNTPLHLLAAYHPETPTDRLTSIPDFKTTLVFNNQNDSVAHVMNYGSPQLEKELAELSKFDDNGPYWHGIISCRQKGKPANDFYTRLKEEKDAQLVVAALIATATFAAAFSMPGGYDSEEGPNQGTAFLTRNAAFQTFIITDALAMTLSLFAVYLHFIESGSTHRYLCRPPVLRSCFRLTKLAMVAMVVAFVTGTYAVLASSSGLAIAVCVIGLSFFFLMVYHEYYKGSGI